MVAAARRAFRVENHLRINNHNNLFYGFCTIASIRCSPTKIFCQFIVVWNSVTMEMGKGLIVAMVILAHLQLQLVWLDSNWEIPLFFWHLTKVTHDPQSVTPRHPKP